MLLQEWLKLSENSQSSYDFRTALAKVFGEEDLIVLDWNTAMIWYRKNSPITFAYLIQIWGIVENSQDSFDMWKDTKSQPAHYLIAAALAIESKITYMQMGITE